MARERLQKLIAAAGISSRRGAEKLIASGEVEVNGKVVTELGTKADPESDHIRVHGKLIRAPERHVYLVMNKPKGYVTTVRDPQGRPTVVDLVGSFGARIYPVGRLDYHSEGLVLLTNDGDLAYRLMQAAAHVPKTYLVKVAGRPRPDALAKIRHGLMIPAEGGRRVRTAPVEVRLVRESDNPWYELTMIEGRNRQIRRMFEEVGHHVEKIRRVRYGPLKLDVAPGEVRRLEPKEVEQLRRAAGLGKKSPIERS